MKEHALEELCQGEFSRALAELQRLVRQPSVAAQGVGIAETVRLVVELVEASGGSVQVLREGIPGNPVIYADFPGAGERTLLFYDHYDVQPAEPLDEWTTEPFGGEVKDGTVYGRGVADNKGEIVARLAAIRAIRAANGGTLPCRVKFLIEGEEEIGSPALYPALARYADLFKADACIWEFGGVDEEGRPELYGGIKGMAYMQLWVRHAEVVMHSSLAAVVENPAWRLTWALATLKAPDGRVLVPGFYDGIVEPTAEQRALARSIPFDAGSLKETYGIKQPLLADTHDGAIDRLVFQPTCTLCGLEAGYTGAGSKTVLPKRAQAKIDCRLVPGQDPQAILAKFRRHLDEHGFTDVEIELLSGQRAYWTDPTHPFVDLVVRTAREAFGAEPVYHLSSAGTGPMYGFGQYLGALPIISVGSGNPRSRAHAPDENIRLADFQNAIRHMALLLQEFGR
ncbi:MAG TPA: M20/M25/M40 family metallo-hydrolase [Symbiobacteriaceae bacterium]|nr:M20/M25/M40 family metallo-hydrolase [Symbiobacteriaceae bacterium]